MFKFFNPMAFYRNARANEDRLIDVQDVLLVNGFQPGYDEEEADTVERAIESLAAENASLIIECIARGAAGKVFGAALAEQVALRLLLVEAVEEALQVTRGVNTPNGTTRKLDRLLTEALAAQPVPTAEETPVEPDEDGVKDVEADFDEVPADDVGIRDLEQDAKVT